MHPTTTALEAMAEQMPSERAKLYLRSRVLPQLASYHTSSLIHRRRYYGCTLAGIVLGALIPVLSLCSDQGLWVRGALAMLGSVMTGLNAFAALDRSKELWISYRQIQERLTSTLCMYLAQVEIFASLSQEERDAVLVVQCEEWIGAELANRLSIYTQSGEL